MSKTPLTSVLKRNVGILVGYQGWVIGLALALLGAGEFGMLLEFLLPSALMALGLALSAILTLELIALARPDDKTLRMQTLMGLLVTHVGLLLVIVSEWVMPEVVTSEGFREVMNSTHSATTVSPWVSAILIGAGCVLLWRALRRLLSATNSN